MEHLQLLLSMATLLLLPSRMVVVMVMLVPLESRRRAPAQRM